jgi:hypothetical protein
MKIKYRSGYAEGGFLDDGASVDPVSGNEVPVGSLAEEVRDDVPAQLSEGEFVVPADVVRFIGLDKLMKMRNAAKAGLAEMEAEGQVGGQPAPAMEDPMMDDDMEMDALIDGMDGGDFDSAVQRFAEGGSVAEMPTYETYTGGRKFAENTSVVYAEYTNDAGDIIKIAHVKGKPVTPVPEGYYLVGSKPVTTPTQGGGNTTGSSGQGNGKVDNLRDPNNPWNGIVSDTDTDTIKLHHTLRSDKITRNRNRALDAVSKDILDGNVDPRGEANSMTGYATNEDLVSSKMDALMTPDALAIYDRWVTDPNFIDKWMMEGKSSVELKRLAQNQVHNKNKRLGLPDPGYTEIMNTDPTKGKVFSPKEKESVFGKTPNLSALFKSIAEGAVDYVKAGGMVQAFFSAVGNTFGSKDKLKEKVEDIVSTIFNTGTVPEEAVVIATQLDTLVEDNVATSTDIIPPNRGVYPKSSVVTSAFDPDITNEGSQYDSTVPPQLGGTTFTDYTPEGVIIDEDITYTTEGSQYSAESLGVTPNIPVEVTGTPDDNTTGFVDTPTVSPTTYDDEMRDLTLDDTITDIDAKKARDDLDKANATSSANDFFDEMALTAKENAALSTGAKLGSTGVTGTTALDIGLPTISTDMSAEERGVRDWAIALGGDPDEAWEEWQQSSGVDPAVNQRELDETERRKIRDAAAAERAAKIAQDKIDRAKEREIRASQAKVKRLADDRRDKANTEAAKDAAAKAAADREAKAAADRLKEGGRPSQNPYKSTVNSGGGGDGPKGNNGFGASSSSGSTSSGQTDYGFYNHGGLATKMKPAVKKMRNDPTAGLASKKKAKQKAQAKKGALAAKRT